MERGAWRGTDGGKICKGKYRREQTEKSDLERRAWNGRDREIRHGEWSLEGNRQK